MFVYMLNLYERHACSQIVGLYKNKYSAMNGLRNFIKTDKYARLHYWAYSKGHNEWIGYLFDDFFGFGWEKQLFLSIEKTEVL